MKTSIQILEDYGFDGLDIDYEYPRDYNEARGYVDLLRELRHALDAHAHRKNLHYKYPLTVRVPLELMTVLSHLLRDQIAAPCGPSTYEKLLAREMDQYLTFWNLMVCSQ